jgi:iron(III) transport system ATP-binding protein
VVADTRIQLPPEQRRIGMVFQDYAIFPHLDVAKNVGFGLNNGETRSEKDERVKALLQFVGLDMLGGRMPHELSGGQQQRVALARALAPGPRALLLDEPFSNLDAALRSEVRAEVKALLRQSKTTTIFVTHDQEEALFFGDLVGVMRAGRIEQIGTPEDVYLRPKTQFVAAFMGQTDFIPGEVKENGVHTPLGQLPLFPGLPHGTRLEVAARPNHVALSKEKPHNGRIVSRQFLGIAAYYRVALNDGNMIHSWQPYQFDLLPGVTVRATFREGELPPMFLDGLNVNAAPV